MQYLYYKQKEFVDESSCVPLGQKSVFGFIKAILLDCRRVVGSSERVRV